jgi:hypothetical protein
MRLRRASRSQSAHSVNAGDPLASRSRARLRVGSETGALSKGSFDPPSGRSAPRRGTHRFRARRIELKNGYLKRSSRLPRRRALPSSGVTVVLRERGIHWRERLRGNSSRCCATAAWCATTPTTWSSPRNVFETSGWSRPGSDPTRDPRTRGRSVRRRRRRQLESCSLGLGLLAARAGSPVYGPSAGRVDSDLTSILQVR